MQVSRLTNVTAVAAGYSYSLAVAQVGHAWAWGSNRHGQLGDGTRKTGVTRCMWRGSIMSLPAPTSDPSQCDTVADPDA